MIGITYETVRHVILDLIYLQLTDSFIELVHIIFFFFKAYLLFASSLLFGLFQFGICKIMMCEKYLTNMCTLFHMIFSQWFFNTIDVLSLNVLFGPRPQKKKIIYWDLLHIQKESTRPRWMDGRSALIDFWFIDTFHWGKDCTAEEEWVRIAGRKVRSSSICVTLYQNFLVFVAQNWPNLSWRLTQRRTNSEGNPWWGDPVVVVMVVMVIYVEREFMFIHDKPFTTLLSGFKWSAYIHFSIDCDCDFMVRETRLPQFAVCT